MTFTEELRRYSEECISGNIPVCKKHKQACQRFLSDLSRQDTMDFPYLFQEEKAEKFLSWMRLFKHTKGILTGKHIEPHIIQKFVCGNLYGWVDQNTGYRRFNKIYWQVARKNAKSQTLALIALYEAFVFSGGTEMMEIYCAATKTAQAKIVYAEAEAMLKRCVLLKDKYKTVYNQIEHKKSGSIIRTLSEEDRKTGDGLSPQCGIIDEYHAHETAETYDVLDSGMGARSQPLLAIITTAGFELNYPCYRVEYDLIKKILDPDVPTEMENYFVMVNELEKNETSDTILIDGRPIAPGDLIDDINDERAWPKANPIICSYDVGIAYLRKKLEEAKSAPEKMRNFLTKHLNIWLSQNECSYMDLDKWAACKGILPDLFGAACYVGFDLSSKLDLTSVTFEFIVEDKYIIISHSFMPVTTYEKRCKMNKAPFGYWVSQGWLTLHDGPLVDYRKVKDYVIETAKENGWYLKEMCFDPWGATQIGSDLRDMGYEVVAVVQGLKTLSEPTKDFRDMVYAKRVLHDGNGLLTWAISNAISDVVDRNLNIILNKGKSRDHIDPLSATINAHVRAMVSTEEDGGTIIYA